MIISDRFRFVYVHIPKCAGSYIRRNLGRYDDTKEYFGRQGDREPFNGVWHYAHIPMCVLEQYFPAEFERLKTYSSYALIRDPFERFPSSVAQRLKQFKGKPIHSISQIELQREVEGMTNYLAKHNEITDPTYVHFNRQSNYLELDGEFVVGGIYTVNNIKEMLDEISNHIGAELSGHEYEAKINETNIYRHEYLRHIFETIRPFIRGTVLPVLPEGIKNIVRDIVYVTHKTNTHDVFESDDIKSFIREYYQRDLDIYGSVKLDENSKS